MLPRQVVSYRQLLGEGLRADEIKKMSASLRLFPTPFKGIYYIPSKEERKGWFIDKPLSVLSKSAALFLKSNSFYYTCATAEEFWGTKWRPAPSIHIANEKLSARIELARRRERGIGGGTYRAKKVAHILSFYSDMLVFHKAKDAGKASVKETPYGRFATRSQLRKDELRFRCAEEDAKRAMEAMKEIKSWKMKTYSERYILRKLKA